jgi:hypothetical protein
MKRTISLLAIASLLVGTAIYAGTRAPAKKPATDTTTDTQKPIKPIAKIQRPKVDIVIALDISGSMSGLLDSARQKIWDIVNEAARAEPAPILRVGLVTFGGNGSERDGYVKIVNDLTTDFDSLYGKLIALRTVGATEYVGRVVHRALTEMSWDKNPDTLRQIYVAGNESADQDRTMPLTTALSLARKHDVFVNAIYCGSATSYDAKSWRHVATAGRGMYASIDHNRGTVVMNTPYDQRMQRLSNRLNGTYVGYGKRGLAAKLAQAVQDNNAARVHGSAGASRAIAKTSRVYDNSGWDLVDAKKAGRKVRRSALPAKLRGMSKRELEVYIDGKRKERAAIQAKIRKLAKKRAAYLKTQMKKSGKSEKSAFDYAVKRALR